MADKDVKNQDTPQTQEKDTDKGQDKAQRRASEQTDENQTTVRAHTMDLDSPERGQAEHPTVEEVQEHDTRQAVRRGDAVKRDANDSGVRLADDADDDASADDDRPRRRGQPSPETRMRREIAEHEDDPAMHEVRAMVGRSMEKNERIVRDHERSAERAARAAARD